MPGEEGQSADFLSEDRWAAQGHRRAEDQGPKQRGLSSSPAPTPTSQLGVWLKKCSSIWFSHHKMWGTIVLCHRVILNLKIC